jgi:hypothetical protein
MLVRSALALLVFTLHVHALSNTCIYPMCRSSPRLAEVIQPVCQTVFAHFNLVLHGLDGDLREVEHNYMIIIAKGINHGRLRDSLQMIDPASIFHIEGVGEKAFPSLHHHGEKTIPPHHTSRDEGDNEAHHQKHHDHGADEDARKLLSNQDGFFGLDWELLLEEEGHHERKDNKGMHASAEVTQKEEGRSSSQRYLCARWTLVASGFAALSLQLIH